MCDSEYITTPEAIQLYEAHGLKCDQTTISCLARQGRFQGRKMAGSWVFTRASVLADIRLLKITSRRNRKEVSHANQQA